MLSCRIFGHQPVFRTEGAILRWECGHGCGDGGSKTYDSAEAAARYAAVFNKRDADDLGKRAPVIGLLPLRLWRRFRR